MSAPVANFRTNLDKIIVDDVTSSGCAGLLGPFVPGTVLPDGTTTVPGTPLFSRQAIEEHQDAIARGPRTNVLRTNIAAWRTSVSPRMTTTPRSVRSPMASPSASTAARRSAGSWRSTRPVRSQAGQRVCRFVPDLILSI